jgi:hypothetical protein
MSLAKSFGFAIPERCPPFLKDSCGKSEEVTGILVIFHMIALTSASGMELAVCGSIKMPS